MLSDELQSKPELLVEFMQNASIPLGEGLEELESTKEIGCLFPVSENSVCSQLPLSGPMSWFESLPSFSPSFPLPDASLSQQDPTETPSSSFLGSLNGGGDDRGEETTTVQQSDSPRSPQLLDIHPTDSTSFILLNLARAGFGASAEALVFVQDEAEDDGTDYFPSSENGESSAPWYLRVQELAHDSLIAATRAQLAKDAKASNHGETTHGCSTEGQIKGTSPSAHLPRGRKTLKCNFKGCDRTFVWPAHLKYHLKTHKNDRSFVCPFEHFFKKSFSLTLIQITILTKLGACTKSFIITQFGWPILTSQNLVNFHPFSIGEKPFACEAVGCTRSFAEYSSLRKHMLVHSGEKPHQCTVCGKTFSQSGSRNVHMKKHHGNTGVSAGDEERESIDMLAQSSLLADPGISNQNLVSMSTQSSLVTDSLDLHHAMLGVEE
uniref:Zinc finger protein 410 n=1 Tax=Latimeria chalumnae TaxID=7897 RepID=H3BG69_LATCH